MKAYFQKRILKFKKPSGTSRGVLYHKPAWYIYLYDEEHPSKKGIGECSIIPGLSVDNEEKIEDRLSDICKLINDNDFDFEKAMPEYPAIEFGLETALLDFQVRGSKNLFPTEFTDGAEGIETNGLIWMDDVAAMVRQIEDKISQGFSCIKLKIGALDTEDELQVIRNIRSQYSEDDIEIRVDANGAYSAEIAYEVMGRLADLNVHSIEQPILPSQVFEMANLCRKAPIPVALDEELFAKHPFENKQKLVEIIKPHYLVLKPSMLGGFKETMDWVNIAGKEGIGWWITSALESNIGLNAIAQWCYAIGVSIPQGLGTGGLFVKNVDSPLTMKGSKLFYDPSLEWSYDFVY